MTAMAFINVRPEIRIDGEADADLQQALTAFVVNLPLHGIGHAELTLTNWLPSGERDQMDYGFQSVTLGKSLEIIMAGDRGQSLFKGEITAVEERYGDGAPQLILLVQDKLHRMVRQRNSRAFEDRSYTQVIESLARDAGLQADVAVSEITTSCHQLNESDLAFAMRLASYFDVALRLEGDMLRARPEEPDGQPLELDARDSALKVRLISDLNHQPTRVTVKGFNPANGEILSEATDSFTPAPSGTTAADTLSQLGWAGEEIVPQPFPRSRGEADAFSRAGFRRAARQFVRGEIRAQGEPGLSSGREITLSGVSPRFAGNYRVNHCVHRFDSQSGFETHLKIARADWQP